MLNLYDLNWLKATLEMGRTDAEYPPYKILKLLCDQLEIVAKDIDHIDFGGDVVTIMRGLQCGNF